MTRRAVSPVTAFELMLKVSSVGTPEREFRFHPERRWRFDFAWPDVKVAVEIDGGGYGFRCRTCRGTGKASGKFGPATCRTCGGTGRMVGGHNTATGSTNDAEKGNAAVVLGWRVLRFTTRMLERSPGECVQTLETVLGKPEPPFKRPSPLPT